MRHSKLIRPKFLGAICLVIFACCCFAILGTWKNNSRQPVVRLLEGCEYSEFDGSSTATVDISASRQRISAVCKHHGLVSETNGLSQSTLSNILVSDRYQTLFCFVPKVACSNWKRIFLVLNGRFNSTSEITRTQAHESSSRETLFKNSNQEISHKLRTYKKIIFVRDPMERLLSAYRNKIAYDYNGKFHHRFGIEIIKKYRENFTDEVSENDRASFPEFVKYLVHLEPTEKCDVHWERQHNLCDPCRIDYDFIGRYESLRDDAHTALKLIGATSVVKFPDTGKAPEGEETKTLMRNFFSQIPEQEFNQLEKMYELDYEFFDYNKPKYSDVVTSA